MQQHTVTRSPSADCLTIVGGPHATACPREVAGYADYVVVGEGEYTLPRLLEDLRDGGEGQDPRGDDGQFL